MSRLRIILLTFAVLLFLGISGWYIYAGIHIARTTFPAGAPPQDVKDAIVPKKIDLAKIPPPALRPGDPVRYGSATSAASVIEYGDFACEGCKQMKQVIETVVPKYQGRVRFVWHDLPVEDSHPYALDAAVFSRCAQTQGKFWQAYDGLFAAETVTDSVFTQIANTLRLDPVLLNQCRKDPNLMAAIRREVDIARGDGINAAPFIFVGRKAFTGVITPEVLDREIKLFLAS